MLRETPAASERWTSASDSQPASTDRVIRKASTRQRWHWLFLSLGLLSLVALADWILGPAATLIAVYSVPALAASLRLGPWGAALVATCALLLGIVGGIPNEIFGSVDHLVRLLVIALAGALAVAMALTRQRMELAQGAAEERAAEARLLIEGVQDFGIFMLDRIGRVASWNAGAERIKGYSSEEIIGRHYSCFYPSEDVEDGKPEHQLETARREGHFEGEGWRLRKDGSPFYAQIALTALYGEDGELRGFSTVIRDITERKQLEAQLSHQALHDPLTGLPNRALFLDRVAHALARADRREDSLAVLFFDLDRFKLVNDSLGHVAGDELLVAVAARLREVVRLEDTVSRFGGDEFTVLCENLDDEQDAIAVVKRVTSAFGKPFVVGDRDFYVDVSVGIAFARGASSTPEALLRDADTAMYRAKESGGARHAVFHEDMRPQALERLATENALRHAVEADGFRVVYQPVVSLRTSNVIGLEALVRWDHPTRGRLDPRAFIPLAEETGLIHSIGAFVLDTACRQAGRWSAQSPDDPPLKIFVNLSATQVAHADLPELVNQILTEADADPSTVCLEITETVLMSDASATLNTLLALKDLGVRLAIDDFGTGYSSLGYLRRFPVDYLKVDQSFVEGLGRRPDDSALVAAMTGMARALGLAVIAEGVETEQQLAELKTLGCDFAQGFYLAHPQPAEGLHGMLSRDRRLRQDSAPFPTPLFEQRAS